MADFQSFLFQNMQMIGLEDDLQSPPCKSNNEIKKSDSNLSRNSNNFNKFRNYDDHKNSKPSLNTIKETSRNSEHESRYNSNLKNPSVSTTETFLSMSTRNNEDDLRNDRLDSINKQMMTNTQSNHNDRYNKYTNNNNNNKISSSLSTFSSSAITICSSSASSSKSHLMLKDFNKDIISENSNENDETINNSERLENSILKMMNLKPNPRLNLDRMSRSSSSSSTTSSDSSSSCRNLSSPDSVIKANFKSSTPIVVSVTESSNLKRFNSILDERFNSNQNIQERNYDDDDDDERDVKSPRPVGASNNNNYKIVKNIDDNEENLNSKTSKSIFGKNLLTKVSIFNSFNGDHMASTTSISKEDKFSDSLTNSNYQICSGLFLKNRLKNTRKNFIDDDENLDSPYVLDNINDNDDDNSNYYDQQLKISSPVSNIKRNSNLYGSSNERNIWPKKGNHNQKDESYQSNSDPRKQSIDSFLVKFEEEILKSSKTDMFRDFLNIKGLSTGNKKESQELNSDLDELEHEKNVNLFSELREMTKSHIPWHNLDPNTSEKFIKNIIKSVEDNDASLVNEPVILSKNGNKISQTQVKKWVKLMEKSYKTHKAKEAKNLESPSAPKLTGKQYLINKKRQLFEKVSRKTSKTINDISNSCGEFSKKYNLDLTKSFSKLYANVSHENELNSDINKMSKSKNSIISNFNNHTMSNNNFDSLNEDEELKSNNSNTENDDDDDNNNNDDDDEDDLDLISETSSKPYSREKFHKIQAKFEKKNTEKSLYINDDYSRENIKKPAKPAKPPPLAKSNSNTYLNPDHFYNEISEANLNEAKHRNKHVNNFQTIKSNHSIETKMTDTKLSFENNDEEDESETQISEQDRNIEKKKNERNEDRIDRTKKSTQSRNSPSTEELIEKIKSQTTSSKLPSGVSLASALLGSDLCDDPSKSLFKRQLASIAKLKSPERKILYNEWFKIIKKMEKDPKFDLETLVRTRGRFTEHERISYRDKLLISHQQQKQQRLRCARSEPNFGAMLIGDTKNSNGSSEDKRNGISTAPAPKTNDKLRRNFSTNTHDATVNSKDINTTKSESFSEAIRRNWELEKSDLAQNKCSSKNGSNVNLKEEKAVVVQQTAGIISSAVKLTLQKSDINYIKEILKKKDKGVIPDLSSLGFGNRNKSPATSKDAINNNLRRGVNRSNSQSDQLKASKLGKFRLDKKNIIEECDNSDFDDEEDDVNSDRKSNYVPRSNRMNRNDMNGKTAVSKQSALSKSNDLRYRNNSHNPDDKENNLVSKCKNICKSESAKAFCDEVSKIKGKFSNKLKNLASNSKIMHKSDEHEDEKYVTRRKGVEKYKNPRLIDEDFDDHHDSRFNGKPNGSRNNNQNRKDRKNLESDNSYSDSCEEDSAHENDKLNDLNSRNKHGFSREGERKTSSSSSIPAPKNIPNRNVKPSRPSESAKSSPAPSRPPPPKRPPPPRPNSPQVPSSNYSQGHSKTKTNKASREESKPVSRNNANRNCEFSPSPSSRPRKHHQDLPPRPPLPPGNKTSSHRDSNLSDSEYKTKQSKNSREVRSSKEPENSRSRPSASSSNNNNKKQDLSKKRVNPTQVYSRSGSRSPFYQSPTPPPPPRNPKHQSHNKYH